MTIYFAWIERATQGVCIGGYRRKVRGIGMPEMRHSPNNAYERSMVKDLLNYLVINADGIQVSVFPGPCMPLHFYIDQKVFDNVIAKISQSRKERTQSITIEQSRLPFILPNVSYDDILSAIEKSKEMAKSKTAESIMRPLKYPPPKDSFFGRKC